jgi:ribosomal protein L10
MEKASGKSGKARVRDILNAELADTGVVVVAHYAGLSVAQMTAFGRQYVKPAVL